jgi:hypothetical protein
MFARKLGRLSGLVFVLVFAFGGVGAAAQGQHESGSSAAVTFSSLSFDWD